VSGHEKAAWLNGLILEHLFSFVKEKTKFEDIRNMIFLPEILSKAETNRRIVV
jgi:hypothetical protein